MEEITRKEYLKRYQRDNKERLSQYKKQYSKANKSYGRKNHLISKYKISAKEFEMISIKQANVCKICLGVNNDNRPLYVDHCHKTNKIRGLLCHYCNSMLGMAKDCVSTLEAAIIYLQAAEGAQTLTIEAINVHNSK